VNEISFQRPEMLWSVTALALVLLVLSWLTRRRRFVAFSGVRQLELLSHRPSLVRRMPWVLATGGLALIVVALMEPVIPYRESAVEAQGLDIVLVLDLSSSMLEKMGAVSPVRQEAKNPEEMRLNVTKEALRDFIRRRREDRIGLVVFSERAYVISPLSMDHDYVLRYVDEIDDTLPRSEGRTAIGEGIHLANVLLARQSFTTVRNKVIVIFTDGEHNSGRDPIEALGETSEAEVRAHLIGVNLDEVVKKKPAVAELIRVVRHLGGQYFQADSAIQLRNANRALAALEKGRLSGKHIERNVPIYRWFAIPALILLVGASGLRAIPYFTDVT
jgi:Ca-activated chloride channel family protein